MRSPNRAGGSWSVWVVAGFAASATMAVASQMLVARQPRAVVSPWWFRVTFPPSSGAAGNYVVFYAAMAVVIGSWLALGRHLDRMRPRSLLLVGALWAAPFLFSPPLFSRDMFSYVAQGTLAHLHLSPYSWPATALVGYGKSQVLATTSPVWRTTPTPYGPAWLVISSAAVALSRGHIVATLILLRLVDLAGVALAAISLPRLARLLGADPVRAVWLGALSPLVLFSLVAAGHNDALMLGLTAASATAALEGRFAAGVALGALATAVKLPGVVGLGFVALSWMRSEKSDEQRVRALGAAGVISAAVLSVVTLASGFGWGWLSPSAISAETQLRLPLSPTTALGESLSKLAGAFGIHLRFGAAVAVPRIAGLLAAAAVVAGLAWRSTRDCSSRPGQVSLGPALGLSLMAVVLLGPVVLPWYLTWGLVMLAASPGVQSWPALVWIAGGYELLTSPDGTIFLNSGWVALPVTALLAAAVALAWARRRQPLPAGLEWLVSEAPISAGATQRAASPP